MKHRLAIILTVEDNGAPSLVAYRRAISTVPAK
jgi:hypothetical protein